jgi:hypothetical protein
MIQVEARGIEEKEEEEEDDDDEASQLCNVLQKI